MANEYKPFNIPIPQASGKSKIKLPFSVFSNTDIIDNGYMSLLENVDVSHYPYVVPLKDFNVSNLIASQEMGNGIWPGSYTIKEIKRVYNDGYNLAFVCRVSDQDMPFTPYKVFVCKPNQTNGHCAFHSCDVKGTVQSVSKFVNDSEYLDYQKAKENNSCYCLAISNLTDIASTDSTESIRIFDYRTKVTMTYTEPDEETEKYLTSISSTLIPDTEPMLLACCVCGSRIFGTDGQKLYVSNFNFAGWTLDTALTYSSSNAWMSVVATDDLSPFHTLVSFNQSVYAFKNNEIYVISGTKNPYRVQKISDEKSIVESIEIINNILYFFNGNDVIAYDGNSLNKVSSVIDFGKYDSEYLNSFKIGDNYVMVFLKAIMVDSVVSYQYTMLMYNTKQGLWSTIHSAALDACADITDNTNNYRYPLILGTAWDALVASGKKLIYGLADKNNTKTGVADWRFATGINYLTMGIKKIHKVQIFCEIQDAAKVDIYLLRDGEAFNAITSKKVYSYTHDGLLQQKLLSVIPNVDSSCKTFKLHFECSGYIKFFNMELTVTKGGEVVNG